MSAKEITYSEECRQAILRRVDKLAHAVKIALGPRGRNVIIEKKFGAPVSTKDGVSVAREIDLAEPRENMGAQMVREVASKTSDVAGDGTTTATILTRSIFREGVKAVTSAGLMLTTEAVVSEIRKDAHETADGRSGVGDAY